MRRRRCSVQEVVQGEVSISLWLSVAIYIYSDCSGDDRVLVIVCG